MNVHCIQRSLRLVPVLLAVTAASGWAAETLVKNGDFEQGDPAEGMKPAFWDKPDGLGVQWTKSPDASHGKAIRMDTAITEIALNEQCKKAGVEKWIIPNPTSGKVGENYGLSLYSDSMPVKKGQPYKITFDYKGPSGSMVWVRGYGTVDGEKRQLWSTYVNCRVANGSEWITISQEFFPTKERAGMKNLQYITEMRVMLYAIVPTTIYWFDNVKIEPISVQEYEELRKTPAPVAHGRKK